MNVILFSVIFLFAVSDPFIKEYSFENGPGGTMIFVNGKKLDAFDGRCFMIDGKESTDADVPLRMSIDGVAPWDSTRRYKLVYVKFPWNGMPGKMYTFSYWMKTDINGKGGYVTAHFEQQRGNCFAHPGEYVLYKEPSCIKESSEWRRYELKFRTPKINGDSNYCVITLGGSGNDSARIWLKDIKLEEDGVPEAIKELQSVKLGPGDYRIEWEKYKGIIKYYRIYKSAEYFSGTSGIPAVAVAGPDENSYTVKGLAPGRYYFAITAVDDYGNENPEMTPLEIMVK